MTQFTKKELFEIEKHFDNLASSHSIGFVEQLAILDRASASRTNIAQEAEQITLLFKAQKDLIKSATEAHDVLRTISAKAEMMRDEK